MKTCVSMAATIAVLLSTISCAAQARSPEPVPLDRVECSRCRMLISTEQGGGQIVSADAETRFYDDVACLAADWSTHRDHATAYVRLGSGAWSEAKDASFARPAGTQTPMGSGLVAFATIAEARATDAGGSVLGWTEIVARTGAER